MTNGIWRVRHLLSRFSRLLDCEKQRLVFLLLFFLPRCAVELFERCLALRIPLEFIPYEGIKASKVGTRFASQRESLRVEFVENMLRYTARCGDVVL